MKLPMDVDENSSETNKNGDERGSRSTLHTQTSIHECPVVNCNDPCVGSRAHELIADDSHSNILKDNYNNNNRESLSYKRMKVPIYQENQGCFSKDTAELHSSELRSESPRQSHSVNPTEEQKDLTTSENVLISSCNSQCMFKSEFCGTPGTHGNREVLPDYVQILEEGKSVCGDSYRPFTKPDWFDNDKFQRGQRFAVNHIFGVMYAELLSLMLLFALRGGLEPLIYTGRSDSPFKAFKRYLSTVVRVRSWYDGDIWDENSLAHKNLKVVRCLHEVTRKGMNLKPKEVVAKSVTLGEAGRNQPTWTELQEEIVEDFQASCPYFRPPTSQKKEVYINQGDMGMTQFGFVGLVLVYPKMFGIHWISDDDLDGFAHFWRTIAYLLGTEDRYNLCDGDLATVKQRCRDIVQYCVKPALRSVSRDWIHMSRCLFQGVAFYVPGVKFEVFLAYLCRVLNIEAIKLKASFTFWHYVSYFHTVFLYSVILRIPGTWGFYNRMIDLAVKKALHISPERLNRLEQHVFPYENNT